jgi:putative hydrolase of the HAD superfamily
MPQPALNDVDFWIFDLDNTLYPASCRLFDQVDRRIGLYIEQFLNLDRDAARALQKQYFRDHQTTLNGLMINHAVAPEDFLDFVHQIDVSGVSADLDLDRALDLLPGRKVIFTNGSVKHAENIMGRLGIERHFKDIFDIAAADYTPKPHPSSYRKLVERYGIKPERAAMIDDMPRNLEPAAAMGMATVLVKSHHDWAQPTGGEDYIHHVTDQLAEFLHTAIEQRTAIKQRNERR